MAATTPKKRAIGLWRPDALPVAGTLELVPVVEELVAVRLVLEVRRVDVPEADAEESVAERAADETVPLELDAVVEMAAAAEVIDPVEDAAALEALEAPEAVVAAALDPPVTENWPV